MVNEFQGQSMLDAMPDLQDTKKQSPHAMNHKQLARMTKNWPSGLTEGAP